MMDTRPLKELLGWDAVWYLRRYPDVAEAQARGIWPDPFHHYLWFGRWEGRCPSAAVEERVGRGGRPDAYFAETAVQIGSHTVPLDWPVKGEPAKTFLMRATGGFFERFMSGPVVLDIGYKGAEPGAAVPILPHAIGVDLDYPGYDGLHLPFEDGAVDAVFASHVLEHIPDYQTVLADWFRALRVGGFLVCVVPQQWLYEKKSTLPSKWNGDHQRFYTPASLLREFEESLSPNTYRVRHLADNDFGYVYIIGPDQHAAGCYEIELVIEKIEPPHWPIG